MSTLPAPAMLSVIIPAHDEERLIGATLEALRDATAALPGGVEVIVPAPLVRVVDTVGAGDAYMAGLIDGLWSADLLGADRREQLHAMQAETVQTAMSHAARIAAIVVSRAGANPPTRNELEEPE